MRKDLRMKKTQTILSGVTLGLWIAVGVLSTLNHSFPDWVQIVVWLLAIGQSFLLSSNLIDLLSSELESK